MEYGFSRVCACVPELRVADVGFNAAALEAASREAARNGAQVILFPELSLTGYTCADLFLQDILVERAGEALVRLAVDTASLGSAIIVGLPVRKAGRL
jgi:NAD+ synthase (glutamine-hydrolysing)